MNALPDTRHSLILRLSDHQDQQAWTEFVQLYEPLIHRLALRRGLQSADANEVTQEILLSVAQAVDQWVPSGQQGSFRAWLFTIARNKLINYLVRQSRNSHQNEDTYVQDVLSNQPQSDNEIEAEVELEYQRRLFQWAAERVRQRIRPETWNAFWKTAVQQRPIEEVAKELGLSVGNIYVAKSRVMNRLREEINRLEARGDQHGR